MTDEYTIEDETLSKIEENLNALEEDLKKELADSALRGLGVLCIIIAVTFLTGFIIGYII